MNRDFQDKNVGKLIAQNAPESTLGVLHDIRITLRIACVRRLKINGTEKPVPLSAAIAEARAKPLADVGPPTKEEKSNVGNTNNRLNRTTVDYTLRRLARDKPELLDKIESGELSVNAARSPALSRDLPVSSKGGNVSTF